ncbi:MAG: glycoside hydrolase family 9 protein, partial [Ruminococcus sp.]|nr:glycoside hydrolase family 9 protein [Ruminococcus sp.]
AGVLSGGPAAGMYDKYIRGAGFKRGRVASQKCYVDSAEAFSVNEVSLQWNAPLAWVASYMDDTFGTKPTPEPTTVETTTTGERPETALWGDANEDNKVTVSDAVAVLQYISNQTKYALTDQGKANADLVDAGKGITGDDAIAIQKIDAGLIKQSDCPVLSVRLKNYK